MRINIGARATAWLFEKLSDEVGAARAPDVIIDGGDTAHLPYLRRWFVIPRNKFLNVYLHHFQRSDGSPIPHDHPWLNLSIVLHGEYVEQWIQQGGIPRAVIRKAGDIVFRLPWFAHRIEMAPGGQCWTLFITGPNLRTWGFHSPTRGWIDWKTYLGVTR